MCASCPLVRSFPKALARQTLLIFRVCLMAFFSLTLPLCSLLQRHRDEGDWAYGLARSGYPGPREVPGRPEPSDYAQREGPG